MIDEADNLEFGPTTLKAIFNSGQRREERVADHTFPTLQSN
jgi:hypothetical protein